MLTVGWNNPASLHDVGSWSDIIQIEAGKHRTVGLKSGGTVEAVGSNSNGQINVTTWTDIIEVSAGWNNYGQLNVSTWTDIVQVEAGEWHTVGLKKYGTLVAVGDNHYGGQCNIED